MSSKTPPIPPANRSDKGPGGPKHGSVGKATADKQTDPDKQGQQANTKINTTNQGLQQDR
ncbi:MAG: hypothetical protein JWS10_457 [Cypionkella sp.]|uniref:hypothetical protein n=1 Tax=Cypionkella sp. TaxID=2811411 RepID=UPI0026281970|nr:hypothetical protein [Cypionkella sp.]MDB5657842.1 hypothetical protein [Cypionkella sp.]